MKTDTANAKHILNARTRGVLGTRPVRRLRVTGQIPAAVYGRSVKPLAVELNAREFTRYLHAVGGEPGLITLREDAAAGAGEPAATPKGKAKSPSGGWEHPVVIKQIQRHPVTGYVSHIDFQVIRLTDRIRVRVHVELKGDPIGVKEESGVLEHFLREIEIECLPTEIPSHFTADVAAMKLNDTMYVKDLPLPPNAKLVTDPNAPVASVQTPRAEEPAEAAPAAEEPEVIREKKPGEEESPEAKGDPGKGAKGEPQKGPRKADEDKS
ncbi:MAG TPA: 50S ribosomal protein L25 [bacterium]